MTGRTLSLPRRHFQHADFECSTMVGGPGAGVSTGSGRITPDDGFQNRRRSQHRSGGTFSLHGTLRRNHSSSGNFNTTLEDDVFEDSISAPNSAKPLLHNGKNQNQYFPHLYNLSPYGK